MTSSRWTANWAERRSGLLLYRALSIGIFGKKTAWSLFRIWLDFPSSCRNIWGYRQHKVEFPKFPYLYQSSAKYSLSHIWLCQCQISILRRPYGSLISSSWTLGSVILSSSSHLSAINNESLFAFLIHSQPSALHNLSFALCRIFNFQFGPSFWQERIVWFFNSIWFLFYHSWGQSSRYRADE